MKKIAGIFILFLTLTGSGQQRKSVIVNPEFESSNATDWIQFSRIELTDTATIVYADVYNRPNQWIRILPGSTLRSSSGKIYKLTDCIGFELDKEVPMPESGNRSFTLYFEPIDKKEQTVDFYESENENDWRIYGIKLYPVKPDKPIQCLLKGEVINRPQSSRLILLKEGEDARTAKITYIPVREGKFEYLLYADAEEAYQLIFYDELLNGSWYAVDFIAEQGTIHFVLQPVDEWETNLIEGGKHNNEYQSIKKEIRAEISPLYDSLNVKYESLEKEGKMYSPEAKALEDESRKIYKRSIERELQYAKEHPGIAGYTFLRSGIRRTIEQTKEDISPMIEIYDDIYKSRYPGHPYSALIESYINAFTVKAGNPYIDVTAVDINGKEVKLSELIRGNVALIHLWASWCGPCRKHGKEMIPVYEMYKDKGFTVVGIARENNKNAMLNALEKDKCPWINLLELNDQHKIWMRYGIGNAGGGEFLVDENGIFLSVNPTVEQVKQILENKYD
jgi:thiol-disulfide isomerase/thioredoxin